MTGCRFLVFTAIAVVLTGCRSASMPKVMLQIRLWEAAGNVDEQRTIKEIFSPEFLLKRPLLQAIDGAEEAAPVLLIDELDRAEDRKSTRLNSSHQLISYAVFCL